MVTHTSTAFPLQTVTEGELEQLCQVLWGSPQCSYYADRSTVSRQQCQDPDSRFSHADFHRLSLFFDFYKQVTSSYVPDFFDHDDQALRFHQDLFDIISLVGDHGGHLSREECRLLYFSRRGSDLDVKREDGTTCNIPRADQDRAFNIATTIMTMARASSLNDGGTPSFEMLPSDEEQGRSMLQDITSPFLWRPEQTLHDALLDTFPSRPHPSLQPGEPQSKTILSELTAINLTKIAKLKFVGTSDLRSHLRLDPATGTVHIFHHTTFLKQHLLFSKRAIEDQLQQKQNLANNLGTVSSSHFQQYDGSDNELSLAGTDPKTEPQSSPYRQDSITPGEGPGFIFPRSLALETLQTLNVLFPPPSHAQFAQCQSLLRSLVSKSNFDPDILRFGTTAYQLPWESKLSRNSTHFGNEQTLSPNSIQGPGQNQCSSSAFPVWGTRLMALYSELEDPTPRGILDNWLERRSKSRHVMLVTLAGVTVAILLGILSLGVSIFQAWISWEAWKHPV